MNNESNNGTSHTFPPVPFDSELAKEFEQIRLGLADFRSIAEFAATRTASEDMPQTNAVLSRGGKFKVEERTVPGPDGAPDIILLIIRPLRLEADIGGACTECSATGDAAASEVPATTVSAPTPAFYFIHGGGMITGNRRGIDDVLLDWAEEFGAAFISVEYRLAPEAPHPAPVEDCYAGLKWLSENAAELDIDPSRLILIGQSAGGGLAAATALLARDRGGPSLMAQMLLCPMLDDRNNTPSALQGEGRGVWDCHANKLGWTALLGDNQGGENVSPYASPARATDLSGLPPALIDVGSAETFRDESISYANAIWYSGGQAELHVYAGAYHGYDGLAPNAKASQDTLEARRRWLHRVMR
ncbi:MAG: alpha/beta hydrolase [Oscillospiraceae bacterium]|nr:alpha/beta hydrolase [Oscillospiraceae bacterium]